MLNVCDTRLKTKAQELSALSPEAQAVVQQLLERISEQSKQIATQQQEIKWRDAKIEKITFELARLKAWRYAAKSEQLSAEQRQLFEDTLAEDEASLRAQLEALQQTSTLPAAPSQPKRQPKRQALPEHLKRIVHRHEPENTTCQCGEPMQRIGEDISERLDIIPAQFFVHQHIRGKWACKCCQRLAQEPVDPQIVDAGIPTSGLVAHTLVSRFVDHLPYYRQEAINARSGVHTPRSTLAQWAGRGGAQLEPLYDAQRAFVLKARVLHADETPVPLLDPGAGKTKRAYIWAYARGALDEHPGVVYEFCPGRGGKYPLEFLQGWTGTLVRDQFKGYEAVLAHPQRISAGCLAHARRKFDELIKANGSAIAQEALKRIAAIYQLERQARALDNEARLELRQQQTRPLWDELHVWLRLERTKVPDGSATALAIDYSLNAWGQLTHNLSDAQVPVGRVGMWRGDGRSRHRCFRLFRLAVPYEPDLGSVSTSPSSNRTCATNASGSLPTHQAFAFERSRADGIRRISPNFS